MAKRKSADMLIEAKDILSKLTGKNFASIVHIKQANNFIDVGDGAWALTFANRAYFMEVVLPTYFKNNCPFV